jgi:hypothetical protein
VEGTLSLGIFDKAGKLVRTLHREATAEDLTVALNGLTTHWDGNNDAGQPVPKGNYSARGYAVGEIDIEGVALHGNDWITSEDAPHVRKVLSMAFIQPEADGAAAICRFRAETAAGETVVLELDSAGELLRTEAVTEAAKPVGEAPTVSIREGRVFILGEGGAETEVPGVTSATYAFRLFGSAREGRPRVNSQSVWVIEKTATGTEVKQFLTTGEFRRRLKVDPAEPQPVAVTASLDANQILLLEEGPGEQRVRLLSLEAVEPNAAENAEAPPVQSTWKTVFSRSIMASGDFAAVAGKLGRPEPLKPELKHTVRLLPNPLLKDESTALELQISTDSAGAFLRTHEGLPLATITEAPNLKWAVMGREGSGKILTILQSDGAVVEEFRVRKLANMMAFDAGDYEWAGR